MKKATAEISANEDERPPKAQRRRRVKARPAIPDPATFKSARQASLPSFVEPMLASLLTKPPAGKLWIHEIKFDGYRLQARIEVGRVKLLTRKGLDWTAKFGKTIVDALAAISAGPALLDGELVVESVGGPSDFSALQADLSEGRTDRFVYYVFDILHFDGYDLLQVPLLDRKALLEPLLAGAPEMIRYSDHVMDDGPKVLQHACRLGLEGIVSKRADAPYRSGRVKSWTKAKCSFRQEFVIAGYKPSTTGRKAVGSLVLGVYDETGLVHVGRVGTGYTHKVAEDLWRRLEPLRVPKKPFVGRLTANETRGVRFVRPELVAEIEFRAWTADGHLRHASFVGLREDKSASEIVREVGS
jgi:bifunctional non-homologous end joining protein LigD